MIEITPLYTRDLQTLARIWSESLKKDGFPCTLTSQDIEEHVLLHGGEPRAILAIDPKGWLVARQNEEFIGFVHCTVGRLDSDGPETLRGIIRTLVIAENAPAATAGLLLRAADAYFDSQKGLSGILAFYLQTGYPRVHFGRGAIIGEAWDIMDALGKRGYQLTKRWLFFERSFANPIPEQLPELPRLTLFWQDDIDSLLSLHVRLGKEEIAFVRFMLFPQLADCIHPKSAGLHRLFVKPAYQQLGIGRWLLERGSNMLLARGIQRLLIDVPHEDAAAQSRLLRLGFQESSLRGYSYERPTV